MPLPSTMISATRLQSTVSPSLPMMASATMATWLVVSTNQAWSSSASLASARAPPPPPAICSLMMLAMSCRVLHSVTVTFSGSLILSFQLSLVIRSVMVTPNSGSGTRHTVPITSLSSVSPVARLRSSPPMVIVTAGSQCRFNRSSAQRRSISSVSLLWSVSTRSFRPHTPSFRLRYSPERCRFFFPMG